MPLACAARNPGVVPRLSSIAATSWRPISSIPQTRLRRMPAWYEPLNARDAWFLYAERAYTPLELSTAYVFERPAAGSSAPGAAGLRDSVAGRLHLVPPYRQRILFPPLALGHPG